MYRYITGIIIFILLTIPVAGCGGGNVKPQVSEETVREQYEDGIGKLRANDLKGAEQGFLKVIEIAGKSPYGYAGMALLELARTNYDDALSNADRAIKLDPSVSDAHAVRGRVLTIRKKGRKWFEESMASLNRAIEIAPEDQRALYYAAECCLDARRYDEARGYYAQAVGLSGPYDTVVAERLTLVCKMLEAGDITEAGSLIALDDKIDRADLAELLVSELHIGELIRDRRPDLFGKVYDDDLSLKRRGDVPRDVAKNRSRDAIMELLAIGSPSLEVFPDGYFYPDRLVTRARMAGVLQDILVMMKNSTILSTIYVGADSPYYDVHHEYYAFNAVMLCTRCGILAPSVEDGKRFDPEEPVSGIDALLMIRALERLLDTPLSEFYAQAGYPMQAE